MTSGSWTLLAVIAGWVVWLGGLGVLAWALIGDRARGRARCPRCWYSLEGIAAVAGPKGEEVRCPECGRSTRRGRRLYRARRRWGAAAIAVMVLWPGGYALNVQDRIRKQGWRGAVPNAALAVMAGAWMKFPPPPVGPRFGGMTFSRVPFVPPPSSTLEEELDRRLIAQELNLAERYILYTPAVVHMIWLGSEAVSDPPGPDRLIVLFEDGLSRNMVPLYLRRRMWNMMSDRLVRTRSTWVCGEPLYLEIERPACFPSGARIRIRGSWPEADRLNIGNECTQSGGMVLPAITGEGPWMLTAELRQLVPDLSSPTGMSDRVLWSRRYAGPQRLLASCQEIADQRADDLVCGALVSAVSVGPGPDGSANLRIDVRKLKSQLPEDLVVGAVVTLINDGWAFGSVTVRASYFLDSTVEAVLPIRTGQISADAWSRPGWRLEIVSDPCAVLRELDAAACWSGRATIAVSPVPIRGESSSNEGSLPP